MALSRRKFKKLTYKAELAEMKRLVEEEGKSIGEAMLQLHRVAVIALGEHYAELEMKLGHVYYPEGLYQDWAEYRKEK